MHNFVKCLFPDMLTNFTDICSYLTDTEQKISWHYFGDMVYIMITSRLENPFSASTLLVG